LGIENRVRDVFDLTNVIEAAGTGIGGTVVLFGALWKPVVRRHDERQAVSRFLAGTPASPGMKAVPPAGDRLATVETGVHEANKKLDGHSSALEGLATAMTTLTSQVDLVVHQTETNQGGSMHDTIDDIAKEQSRVATEKSKA
jgi:hypothetical protein